MKLNLTNAFSIQMLKDTTNVKFKKLPGPESAAAVIKDYEGFKSFIGHPDTAAVVGNMIGVEVPMNRGFATLDDDNHLLVAQFSGGRLPEGCTTLPENVKLEFWLVYPVK